MSRRIEIELTSQRSPEEWTWRAAGAKQPKGSLSANVLCEGAKIGDIVKAEADFEIDGIFITSVAAPAGKRNEVKGLLEIKGSGKKQDLVTQQLVDKKDRAKGRGPRRDGDKRPDSRERGPRRDGDKRPSGSRERTERPQRPPRPARPETPTFKKLVPKDDARKAVLAELNPEHRPIAEQVLKGGIPAVRQAIEAENSKAKAEGRPEINGPALIAVAEGLLPDLKAADWMDKATAAKESVNEISVRDLKAVVAGADAVARSDEARVLASELREALDRRTVEARDTWLKDISDSLGDGRVIRALRLSSRPPDAQTKFPPELLERLKTGAEEAMAPETAPERWITLLDAVGNSPVRRTVMPKGLPAEPGDELLSAAKAASSRIPALAKMLGISMPPPPPVRKPLPPKPAPSKPKADASPEPAPAE